MLLNHISYRQATQADWPAIAELLQANKLPLDGAQAHLSHFVVAVQDARIVASAGAEIHGSVALLRSVAVTPSLQRKGLGKALVALIIGEARRRSIGSLHLLSVTAPEYFAQFGFKRGPRENAPAALQSSAEFQGACPACAAFMTLTLQQQAAAMPSDLQVAVIGAGPVGLAAVARLIERGIPPLVLEAGDTVGANMADFGHVRLFSPWRHNIDPAVADLLARTGWQPPPAQDWPLAQEVVERVLKPFAALPEVAPALQLGARVVGISREGFDKVKTFGREAAPFVINAVQDGRPVQYKARAVIDATGTWRRPNPLGANGLPAGGEDEASDAIFYGIPDVLGRDRARYSGKRTLVVGAGHSAANALLSLAELAETEKQTRLAWAVRSSSPARALGGGASDGLPARGRLGSALKALRDQGGLAFFGGFKISGLVRQHGRLAVMGVDEQGQALQIDDIDQIICATGQRPDLTLTHELRVKLDPWLESTEAPAPLIDPNVHSCGTVRPHGHRELSHPESGFYTVGAKSYGRAPTFLMMTGFEQVRSVVAAIDGDIAAADKVELDLPETGVCSLDPEPQATGACCGPTPASVTASTSAAASPVAVPAPVAQASSECGATSCGKSPVKIAVNAIKQKVSCCG